MIIATLIKIINGIIKYLVLNKILIFSINLHLVNFVLVIKCFLLSKDSV
ncbi:Uncharacterised protein [Chlamydia trachomatis]|nr:Uncharacterised protein [Chlamydia trachomatis]